ncbi:MAG: lipase family protein, partial [Planctomycetota bacterium]
MTDANSPELIPQDTTPADELSLNRPRVVQDEDEVAVVVHSNIQGPIERLSFLQRALLFAELALVAYNDEDEARLAA